MKKLLSLLMALLLCLFVVACGGDAKSDNGGGADNGGSDKTNEPAVTAWLVDGNKINADRLRDDMQTVELTLDNWREYIKVYNTVYTALQGDGSFIEQECDVLGAGNERYHAYKNIRLELQHKETGQKRVTFFGRDTTNDQPVDAGFNLDDYECLEVSGTICYWDYSIGTIPADTRMDPEGFAENPDPNKLPEGLMARKGTNYIRYEYWTQIIGD